LSPPPPGLCGQALSYRRLSSSRASPGRVVCRTQAARPQLRLKLNALELAKLELDALEKLEETLVELKLLTLELVDVELLVALELLLEWLTEVLKLCERRGRHE
jgi:hypothetical protein